MPVFSEACERNKGPILDVLQPVFVDRKLALEIGSGTGQHALHFSKNLPHLAWQPSDLAGNLPGLVDNLGSSSLPNLRDPIELDVRDENAPDGNFDAIFSANTLHIMSANSVEQFFGLVGKTLPSDGVLAVYGPFKYNGEYTSPGNQTFDAWLKTQNMQSAIRDFEWVNALATQQGLALREDNNMPANNQCILWQKRL